MQTTQDEVVSLFEKSGALLKGHFILRSGLHSEHYFQCARLGENLEFITRIAELLIETLPSKDFTTVLAPAMGGLVIGQEVARQLKKRFIFVEKVNDQLELRRGFKLEPNEPVLVVEDVITKGGRAQEAIDILKENGANPIALAVIVDRSQGNAQFEIPHVSLVQMSFPTYKPEELPDHLKSIPTTKPGS